MKCPSYTFACKIKSIPGNIILKMGDMSHKIHAEAMFCAYEKSSCIYEEKGYSCGNCDLLKEYELGKGYFCIVSDGK